MPSKDRFREIEIKLPVADMNALKKALKRLGAREVFPRTHERNTLYDTPEQDLRRRGRLVRLRTEEVKIKATGRRKRRQLRAILTYKAPARLRRGRAHSSGLLDRFKVKEEAEVRVDGVNEIQLILSGMGFHPTFLYEKYRTTYLLPGAKNVKVEWDETPVGNYIELEGSPSAIDRAARLLGYRPTDYIRETYGDLYFADCKRRGRKPGHMLFPNGKKLR